MYRQVWKSSRWALVLTISLTAVAFLLPGRADPQPPAAKVADTGKPVEPSRPVEPVKDRRVLLEVIGTLTASHCYQTYLNIGMVADGKSKGVYTEKDAYRVLESVVSLLDTVDKKMGELSKVDLEASDRDTLEQMRKLSLLLRDQGKALQTAWDTGRPEDATKYENVRKDSWAAISKLLGLDK
jgi:hypothetical protein